MSFPSHIARHLMRVEDDFDRMYAAADESPEGSYFQLTDCLLVESHNDTLTTCKAVFVNGETGETTDIGETNTWDIAECARQCGVAVRGLED